MTRLEISICAVALQKFKPWQSSVKTLWNSKIQAALTAVVQNVLQDRTVFEHVFRAFSLLKLLGLLGKCRINLLLIGKHLVSQCQNAAQEALRWYKTGIWSYQQSEGSCELDETQKSCFEVCSERNQCQGILSAPTRWSAKISFGTHKTRKRFILSTWLHQGC